MTVEPCKYVEPNDTAFRYVAAANRQEARNRHRAERRKKMAENEHPLWSAATAVFFLVLAGFMYVRGEGLLVGIAVGVVAVNGERAVRQYRKRRRRDADARCDAIADRE